MNRLDSLSAENYFGVFGARAIVLAIARFPQLAKCCIPQLAK